jgi:hypothetical protein
MRAKPRSPQAERPSPQCKRSHESVEASLIVLAFLSILKHASDRCSPQPLPATPIPATRFAAAAGILPRGSRTGYGVIARSRFRIGWPSTYTLGCTHVRGPVGAGGGAGAYATVVAIGYGPTAAAG